MHGATLRRPATRPFDVLAYFRDTVAPKLRALPDDRTRIIWLRAEQVRHAAEVDELAFSLADEYPPSTDLEAAVLEHPGTKDLAWAYCEAVTGCAMLAACFKHRGEPGYDDPWSRFATYLAHLGAQEERS